jgi:hypothetical protein
LLIAPQIIPELRWDHEAHTRCQTPLREVLCRTPTDDIPFAHRTTRD